MKNLKLRQIEVDIPESWNEITLNQFIEYMKWTIKRPETFENELDSLIFNMKLISIFSFTKLDEDYLNEIDLKDLKLLVDELNKFVLSPPNFDRKDYFVYRDVLYTFIDPNNMSVGEYISYRQLAESKREGLDVLPELLAIICRPAEKVFNEEFKKDDYKIKKFNADEIKDRAELFRMAPAFEVVAAADFFFGGSQKQIKNSKGSVKKRNKKAV